MSPAKPAHPDARVDGLELIWPGKYDEHGRRTPVQRLGATLCATELLGVSSGEPSARLIHGDNVAAMDALLATHAGKVDLIYIDPPFATGGKFSVSTRVGKSRDGKAPPEVDAPAYSDRFVGGAAGFLAMLDPRIRMLRELLAAEGSFYLHVDPTVGHAVKLLLDDVFGAQCFQREIVWRIGWVSGFKSAARNWIRNHDLIFFYTKNPKKFTFNKSYMPYPEGYLRRDGKPPKGKGVPIDDVWNANETEFALRGAESLDSIQIKSFSTEKCGYATQKNTSLARRIIAASSNPGDLVLDVFCGSGTVGVAARELERRFVGVDCSTAAIHIAKKRLAELGEDVSLTVQSVGAPSSMSRQLYRALVLEHHGVDVASEPSEPSEPEAAPFHGLCDAAAVYVAAADEVVSAAVVAELRATAVGRGHASLHILARLFDLPLTREPSGPCPVVLLRVGPDVLNPAVAAHTDAAVACVPAVELRAQCDEHGKVSIVLVAYETPHPERLPKGLRAAAQGPLDLVDAWSVTWDVVPLLQARSDEHMFRTHRRRELPAQTEARSLVGRRCPVLIKFVDVLYQSTQVHGTLCCDGTRAWFEELRLR